MMHENKDLLLILIDLSSRLPHGVICNTPKGDGHLCSINQTIFGTEYGVNIKAAKRDYFNDREVCIKPYLRPLSSMTEEERKEYGLVLCDELSINQYDWLNKNMFDTRGLIPKGLALEAHEGMYNIT